METFGTIRKKKVEITKCWNILTVFGYIFENLRLEKLGPNNYWWYGGMKITIKIYKSNSWIDYER